MISNSKVISLILNKLPDSKVKVENLKGNDHLQVTVISSRFNGLSLVKQHQLVYSALKEELASEAIHALAVKTETPN
ncbi:MAG: BolA family transcriptional regulator [Prochlorococcus marinus CUG1435]|nr:BolA family transcriptional regulator [Prochlorococcus marinus CUG1435]|tara:strand:- start:252 stop:482 length:231 start_codon:yes stop_codon:yes gene_type:complete